ncbi:hypothetical protein PPGU19_019380 [Paraburkholderia sp. PGU19]|uniref:anti-sigma factor family protein n=1 Tax=Paraburkholderia sp. PGU19 TaxID=2735434 RepID=UPI0015DC2E05|nr:zf-HC2 domain-containing protein [Paraburkholderia sp. PGU19]BCF97369.1 hypothetical protein PPGU19_019380 [Paraburkholderia sp. PGU19]
MDCNEARPLLDANADHELTPPQSRDVQRHIESCEACRREGEMVRAMKGAVRSANYYRAPDELRAKIMAALPPTELAAPQGAARDSAMRPEPRARQRKGWFDWVRLPQLPQLPKGGASGRWRARARAAR